MYIKVIKAASLGCAHRRMGRLHHPGKENTTKLATGQRRKIMIAITAYQNQLKSRRKEYCYRSVTDQNLSSEQLIREITGYNSTITEADARAVLSVLNDRVRHFVRMGYNVELPFGFIRLRASGTSDRLNGGFSPGTGDHRFEVVCSFKDDAAKEMEDSSAWRMAGAGWAILPKITELASKGADGRESRRLDFARNDILRIKGTNLSFDATDGKQGVFFIGGDKSGTRAGRYFGVGTAITDVFIPGSLEPGSYRVKIVTSPRKDAFEEFTFSGQITVTAG